MTNQHISFLSRKKTQGFTLLELIVGISILGILIAVGVPSLSDFIVKTRVDNQISEINRLLLTARNTAINTGKFTTVCPLSGETCSNDWTGEISVFTNDTLANSKKYDSATGEMLRVKDAVTNNDAVSFTSSFVIFAPNGKLASANAGTISYCPSENTDWSRGIDISLTGRSYTSEDSDSDGKDEDRNGNDITCS
ncbi:GspH/FimT family pseudopilin [Thalassotalea sp. G2M2-11]|uniref:GspH/FimT family pseudopilin n=1 Tax=Thalassotalea sp. G2M2-11 TaxID=2787627 RepID=UPI0019CF4CBB|nr:GspH/FimT family pseudopilin [Thalassotalea sp. G2M2-11]